MHVKKNRINVRLAVLVDSSANIMACASAFGMSTVSDKNNNGDALAG